MNDKIKRLAALMYGVMLSGAAVAADTASHYPDKPVRIIVPYAVGGGTDAFARALGQKLQERLGQSFIIENRPGAGGNLGANLVAKAAPDGYTLLLAQDSLSSRPYLYRSLPFDVHNDFEPIGIGATIPMVLVVSNQVPASSFAELVSYAKQHPEKLSYGSPGNGTSHHLNFEAFLVRAGLKMIHVPYKGAGPMMNDVAAGVVDVGFAAPSSAKSLEESQKIRVMAVADQAPVPQFPDAPVIAHTYDGFQASVWFGLAAPAGTPTPIIEKLSSEMRAALGSEDLRVALETQGFHVRPSSPAEMRQVMKEEYEQWGDLVKRVGIEPVN